MNSKIVVALLFLVVLPIIGLSWMGFRLTDYEQDRIRYQFLQLVESRLQDINQLIKEFIDEKSTYFLAKAQAIDLNNPQAIEQLIRDEYLIKQALILDQNGAMLYPFITERLSPTKQRFINRIEELMISRDLLYQQFNENDDNNHGWHTWFAGRGLNLIYWYRIDNQIKAIEINREALLAELIGGLPATNYLSGDYDNNMVRLQDEQDAIFYQWGNYIPSDEEVFLANLPLDKPFGSWQLTYFYPVKELSIQSTQRLNMVIVVVAAFLILTALIYYIYRQYHREMQEASQRISFVNQVSHELRTPLTNIRMYSELLAEELYEEGIEDGHNKKLDVVISESQRLSRLIENVLTFSKNQQHKIKLNLRKNVVDDIIQRLIEQFKPSFAAKNIEITFDANAKQSINCDADAIAQILANLLSNIEKYAADGGVCMITSYQDEKTTTIQIEDRGVGIPSKLEEKIFQPFFRIDDTLSSQSGTGIGLSISRQLARLHGGNLALVQVNKGTCFKLTIPHKKVG